MAGRAATSPPASPPPGEQFAEVVVVRHGETSWNASRTIQGQMDPELNETGRRQALVDLSLNLDPKVARRLSREAKPAAVYSSDLKRAAETAQTIATACGVSSLVLDPALRERHMGDLHGVVFDDAVRRSPEIFSSYSRTHEIPGGGESLDQLSKRCVSYLNTVAEKHKGERVIVVTHGASTEELCIHADPTSPVRGKLYNTSICVFRIGGGEWILEKAGDVGHLDQGEFLEDAFGGDGVSA
ncbi:putative phosphoglycerate mutase gpmB [Triticum urartu]|uniref:Putative phosphoglycerate mutase gpmB n=1 Tax=Triticum urartu TaxID=4572 RepID=M8B191_TRIUA|nr:putative phosphoglycerate mutase gpmB [Triticum urartu]